MLRFILIRKSYSGSTGDTEERYETVDAVCPKLEEALNRGGRGGGPDGDDYERAYLIGAEVHDS